MEWLIGIVLILLFSELWMGRWLIYLTNFLTTKKVRGKKNP